MAKKITQYDRKRQERRDSMWPDATDVIYDRTGENGFCTIPRTIGLIATLIRRLSKNDPSRVFWDLWTRQRDDGYVEIEDAEEMAYASALTGTRAVKSWREKLEALKELGFIRIAGKGNQKYKFILLLHPHDVMQRLYRDVPGKIPAEWTSLYTLRIQEIRAVTRLSPEKLASENRAAGTTRNSD